MASKPAPTPQNSLVVRSGEFEDLDGEETEIAAAVTLAPDGGWGWVVVGASFCTLVILDGTVFSFGPLLQSVCQDLNLTTSEAALINSLQIAMYMIFCPLASALINRFGFRTIAMSGSIISSLAIFFTYFSHNYLVIIVTYSLINGLGGSLISMSSSLIVGFYFEKLRFLVLPAVSCGASIGTMIMYPLNVETVKLAGWKTTILLHSGLYGLIYFFALTFRPLTALTIVATEDEGMATRTVTFLPNIEASAARRDSVMQASAAERAMKAVSSAHFPTAKRLVDTTRIAPGAPGTSKSGISRITLKAQNAAPDAQLRLMKSIMTTKNADAKQQNMEITLEIQEKPKNTSCWGWCCDWESNPDESRPMYRDDIFYDGKIENLPAYQKSVAQLPEQERTGLEYQLEVSRAVTLDDLKERRGVCTTAVRRMLATMFDLALLKKPSFIIFCFAGLLFSSGAVVPYVFLQSRAEEKGLDPGVASLLVSVMGFANLIGRILATILVIKLPAIFVFSGGMMLAGVASILSGLSYTTSYQFGYAAVYGLGLASAISLRGVCIVDHYGLENLTNGFALVFMFNGFASFYCTPLCAFLVANFGYEMGFYVSGGFVCAGSVAALMVRVLRPEEIRREEAERARAEIARRNDKQK